MSLQKNHQSDVLKISREFSEWNIKRLNSLLPGNMTLSQQKHISNTMRSNTYKERGPKLEIGHLNRVIEVDPVRNVAWVEPCVTMEELVDATLPYHLVPPVITEFKTITVGGAINGAALESSSHRYSQFNDNCISYEILLGNGQVVKASAYENSDLFYGISGSYGSLGIILSVEIRLIPASPWVCLNYIPCDSYEKALEVLKQAAESGSPPEYLEGTVYNSAYSVVIEGRPLKDANEHVDHDKLSLNRASSPWYYDHVHKRTRQGIASEVIPLRDYLFRHDRGAFWMGAYALYPKLLFRYVMEYLGCCSQKIDQYLMKEISVDTKNLKSPSVVFKKLFGWIMDSGRLYRFMHNRTEQWFADNFCIQDYYLPYSNCAAFIDTVLNEYEMAPLWLCPIKSTDTPQYLSPHYTLKNTPELLFDVGVYSILKNCGVGKNVVQELDDICTECGGKKMLYAYTYATPEKFWTMYSKDDYDSLRKKYCACDVFPEITKKVLS